MTTASNNVLQDVALGRTIPLSPKSLWRLECPTKVFFLSVSPDEVVWLARVDVECILPCSPNPLGRHGDESEQETLDPVRGLDSKEDGHERQCHDVSVEVCSHGSDKQEYGVLVHE